MTKIDNTKHVDKFFLPARLVELRKYKTYQNISEISLCLV